MEQKLPERRRFVRIEVPLKVVVNCGAGSFEVITKNVSPVGLRIEAPKELDDTKDLDMSLYIPTESEPIDLKGKVVWQNKQSLEDDALFDVGVEIVNIGDKNKNIFLRFLCDLLYDSTYEVRS